jgi:hypothetical protein
VVAARLAGLPDPISAERRPLPCAVLSAEHIFSMKDNELTNKIDSRHRCFVPAFCRRL